MKDAANLVEVIAAADIAEGDVRAVNLKDHGRIAVMRIDGEIFVTQDRCSHAAASLSEGWLEGHELCCPVHDGRFDVRTGRHLCFPATEPIRTYPVIVRGGMIWVDLATASVAADT